MQISDWAFETLRAVILLAGLNRTFAAKEAMLPGFSVRRNQERSRPLPPPLLKPLPSRADFDVEHASVLLCDIYVFAG